MAVLFALILTMNVVSSATCGSESCVVSSMACGSGDRVVPSATWDSGGCVVVVGASPRGSETDSDSGFRGRDEPGAESEVVGI